MNIGFIGLGAMGAGIVPRLMAAGHAVTGWNRGKEEAEPLAARGRGPAATQRAGARAVSPGRVPRGRAATGGTGSKERAEPLVARGMRLAETPRAVAAASN